MPHYHPSRKHKWGFSIDGPPVHTPTGSKCDRELGETAAAEMLKEGLEEGWTEGVNQINMPKRVYNYRDGKFYRAEVTYPNRDVYHGFPVGHAEVPTQVKRLMKEKGKLTPREYRKYRASRH